MERGDISNQVVARIVIVWDNLLGVLPNKTAEAKFTTYMRLKRWKRAAGLFEINDLLARQIWDLTWRYDYSVDVVTHFGGDDFAEAVEKRIERADLPVGHVWFEPAESLARSLAYRPSVACVIHANTHHQLTYGSKGRLISASAPNLIGAI